MEDPFHQSVSVILDLKKQHSAGTINRLLKSAGATLHYDVYSFERTENCPIWQSESYIEIYLFHNEKEVYAQDTIDKIVLKYPLATIGSEYIPKFSEKVMDLATVFCTKPMLNEIEVDYNRIVSHCDELVTDLMDEWGEEPGNESLRILIEQYHTGYL